MGRVKLCPLAWKRGKIGISDRGLCIKFSVECALCFFSSKAEVQTPQEPVRHASSAHQHERPARAGHHRARAADCERRVRRTERLCVRALHQITAVAHDQPKRSDRASRALNRASNTYCASCQDGLLQGKERSQQIQSA